MFHPCAACIFIGVDHPLGHDTPKKTDFSPGSCYLPVALQLGMGDFSAPPPSWRVAEWMCACVCACMYGCIHACMCTCVCICAHVYVCVASIYTYDLFWRLFSFGSKRGTVNDSLTRLSVESRSGLCETTPANTTEALAHHIQHASYSNVRSFFFPNPVGLFYLCPHWLLL